MLRPALINIGMLLVAGLDIWLCHGRSDPFPGETVEVGEIWVHIHPNNMLGFAFTLVLVFLFTNLTMRGLVSGMVILGLAFLAVLLAWLNLWEKILFLLPDITIYMNNGFYLFLSGAGSDPATTAVSRVSQKRFSSLLGNLIDNWCPDR
jgi:hypothetical protein